MPRARILQDDFRDFRRDRFIDAQSGRSARLAPTLLLSNKKGVSAQHSEELT